MFYYEISEANLAYCSLPEVCLSLHWLAIACLRFCLAAACTACLSFAWTERPSFLLPQRPAADLGRALVAFLTQFILDLPT